MKNKVVFIFSHGHSGSTVLDRYLGGFNELLSTGELKYYPWQIFRDGAMCDLNQDICTCGKPFSDCELHSGVIQSLYGKGHQQIYKDPLKFKIGFSNTKKYKNNLIQKLHGRFIYYTTTLWRIKPLELLYHSIYKQDIRRNLDLYNSLLETSNKEYVIDSSKDVMRFRFLSKHIDDYKIIVLKRSLTGVVYSYKKRGRDNILEICQSYLNYYKKVFNALKDISPSKICFVEYESFVDDYDRFNKEINTFLGINSTHKYGEELHLVAGNPSRFSRLTELRKDISWKGKLSYAEMDIIDHYSKGIDKVFNTLNLR